MKKYSLAVGLMLSLALCRIGFAQTEVVESQDQSAETEIGLEDRAIRQQVAKIFSSRRELNLSHPWKRDEIKETTGSGVWLGDGKILTNAHVVLYSSRLYVQPFDSSDRITAETVAVSPEMDLAILELEDAPAFEGLEPMSLMEGLPKLRSAVQVYGYPTGGSAISVTEGVVSRIEYASYKYGESGLRIQVDAGINSGNSGGPAIVDGQIAGLVHSRLRTGDNIGYLIPSEEIATFLRDVEDGTFDGKPKVRDYFQPLQNEALRKRFGLESSDTGLVVLKLDDDSEDYPLKVDDVLTHVGQYDIDNDGMVRLENGLTFRFHYFVAKLVKDGRYPATIIRNGEKMDVQVPAGPHKLKVIRTLKGKYPEYFVYGPLVFVEATTEYLVGIRQLIASSSPAKVSAGYRLISSLIKRDSPLIMRSNDSPEFEGEQLIMVAVRLLPHRISKGYTSPSANVLAKVNGIKIKNMKHLVQVLRDCKDEQVKFEFGERNATYLVFDRAEVEKAMEDILIDNAIARQGSKELLREWNRRDED